ncbi:hypothetical protein Scep_013833 [Stephania cephalantha]|uniref:Receptor-like serine/threonine-protein kinase n=1 Tax=Stephania cephalantha TaxID=152367 RepID=A0AAP0NYU0_9MAGN
MAFTHILKLLPLLVLADAQGHSNISLGTSITASGAGDNNPWCSPSGDFAFGFQRLENKSLFLLAIWFDKIPEKTIVWYANGEKPVEQGSRVELTSDGKLVLSDSQGREIWRADDQVNSREAEYAAMLDTGNFVLGNRNMSTYLWESFKVPTDTMLPTQVLELGGTLDSRQERNYSRGRFQFRLLNDGNTVLNPVVSEFGYAAYYLSHTFQTGYQVVFKESGYVCVLRRDGSIVNVTRGDIFPPADFYQRATIDYDGVFRQYSHKKNSNSSEGWSIVSFIPNNICDSVNDARIHLQPQNDGGGSGICGYNSFCSLGTNGKPNCGCPPDYSFIDPNDSFSGCRPSFLQGCRVDEWKAPGDLFDIIELPNTDWNLTTYQRLQPYDENQCKSSCLNDCLCSVALFDGVVCRKMTLPFSNGRQSARVKTQALIKVRKSGLIERGAQISEKKDRSMLIKVLSGILGSSIFLNFLFLAAVCRVLLYINHKNFKKSDRVFADSETNLRTLSYKELEEATQGFKEELGRGSSGIVYKGFVEFGTRRPVAVKKIDRVLQEGEIEFKTELRVIRQTHHKNLVQLLGFCEEGGAYRLLVYEFMENGSLAGILFGNTQPKWNTRIKFAHDIAKGLTYLHEECNIQIIHCDVKPQNILLDDKFTAKISDFGLAKSLAANQSRTRTAIRGTRGYVAPEWFRNTPITSKVDVYSFGVLLLEIICCRKNAVQEARNEYEEILTDWAYDCCVEGRLIDLMENDHDAINDMKTLERLVKISLWCLQEDPSRRPNMKEVTLMLQGVDEVHMPPCPTSNSIC